MNKLEENYPADIEQHLVNDELIDITSETFKKIIFLYTSALKQMKTKIEIIQDELKLFSEYEPIEYVSTRIKKPENIIEKLKRKDCDLTYQNLFEKVNDIAGIRIVCNFKSDVYKIVQIIEDFQDIRVINKKDYMKKPKKSGYMSYHLIVEVPVHLSSRIMFVKVEIQIRTLGMDFWASLEHKLKYKNADISKNETKNLIKYAKVINNIDDNMLTIANEIEKRNSNIILESAENKDDKLKKQKFNL